MNSFQFTISNDQVTGMAEVWHGHARPLHIPSSAVFTIGTGTVSESLTFQNSSETINFTQSQSDPTLYNIASETLTITNPTTTSWHGSSFGYAFTVTGDAVTGMQAVWSHGEHGHSHTQNLMLSPGSSFAINGGAITETLVHGVEVDTITFVQPTGSTLYAVSSETSTFIDPGTATTQLSVNPFDRDAFAITAGVVTGVQKVALDGTLTTVTPHDGVSFSVLGTGLVEESITHGSHAMYEVFYDPTGGGVYTEVAHGMGATVDLAGLQAQLSQLQTLAGTLI
jgi:hypothetical protein